MMLPGKKRQYDPAKDGIITAVKIQETAMKTPIATLAFAFHDELVTIEWNNAKEREIYCKGINGYTVFFDERKAVKENTFESFLK